MNTGRHFVAAIWIITIAVVALCAPLSAADTKKFDASTPLDQLRLIAGEGNAEAMLELGERLIQGEGAEKNIDSGMIWLIKASEAGQSQAWYDLGFVYANGLKGTPDMAEAMKYFRKGADLGNADCQTSLGLFYQAGEKIPGGVKADVTEAVKWYGLAAEQGHTEAIQHLAMMNAMGMGIEQDDSAAVRWFRKGAELGNADCMWGLGQCYLDGKGITQDSVQAFALFSVSLNGVEDPQQQSAMSKFRNDLGGKLSVAQLKQAAEFEKSWKPEPEN